MWNEREVDLLNRDPEWEEFIVTEMERFYMDELREVEYELTSEEF
jgi:hypothetical protein